MSQVAPLRQVSRVSFGLMAALFAMTAFVAASHAQQSPSEELNRQLDQAADQSTQQQDTLNEQLDEAEEQEAEVNDLIEEAEDQVDIQEGELEQQLDQAEDLTGTSTRTNEGRLTLGIAIDEQADVTDGIVVGEIMTGSAAAAAGLRRGDVIVSIDGQTITTVDELDRLVYGYAVGDTADIVVLREGQRYPLAVTFEEAYYLPPVSRRPVAYPRADYPPADYTTRELATYETYEPHEFHVGPHGWLGVTLQPRNPPYRMYGVGVVSVVPGGPAYVAGIRTGDRILAFNGVPLGSAEHLLHVLSLTDPGDEVELLVLSHGYEQAVTLELADASVFSPPVTYWYQAGYHVPWHWHVPAAVAVQSPDHDELLEQHQRLVEQQERMEGMLRDIQSDLATIQRELDVRQTSGTIPDSDLE